MRNRQAEIKQKGFRLSSSVGLENSIAPTDYGKIRVGVKTLNDATYNLSFLKKVNPRVADKEFILRAISSYDLAAMREISDFFYKTSGIYSRMLRYMAFMYKYDWVLTSEVSSVLNLQEEMSKKDKEKLMKEFKKCINYLDEFNMKDFCTSVALKVLKDGVYYGYVVEEESTATVQELPIDYCRVRFYDKHRKPVVEFNMKFFDDAFKDATQRARMIEMFPKEFKKGYSLYKQGKLTPDFQGDTNGWYVLDIDKTVRFNNQGADYPAFISVIPLLLDLDEARELDRQKTLQRLLKIIIQKMPMDKNGELIFDVDEAAELHNNAVHMLGKAVGVDVLTTFADVEVADLSHTNAAAAQADDLSRVERQIYNEGGLSQNQFNSDGNLALSNSIKNDEATMYPLLLQFEKFANYLIKKFNSNKKFSFSVAFLNTTIYNYQDLAKMFKDQTQLGYSKMLPQVALGRSQKSILADAYFENKVLDLVNVFIPPISSATMNAESLKQVTGEGEGAGRKELPDDQKSEKTIANRESMS